MSTRKKESGWSGEGGTVTNFVRRQFFWGTLGRLRQPLLAPLNAVILGWDGACGVDRLQLDFVSRCGTDQSVFRMEPALVQILPV